MGECGSKGGGDLRIGLRFVWGVQVCDRRGEGEESLSVGCFTEYKGGVRYTCSDVFGNSASR